MVCFVFICVPVIMDTAHDTWMIPGACAALPQTLVDREIGADPAPAHEELM